MCYEYFGIKLEFDQLFGKQTGAQMPGQHSQVFLAIRKRRLDDKVTQIINFVDHLPKSIISRGIAAKNQARFAAVQMIADSGHYMAGRDGSDSAAVQNDCFAQAYRLVTHVGLTVIWNFAEIRPYLPVEYINLKNTHLN